LPLKRLVNIRLILSQAGLAIQKSTKYDEKSTHATADLHVKRLDLTKTAFLNLNPSPNGIAALMLDYNKIRIKLQNTTAVDRN